MGNHYLPTHKADRRGWIVNFSSKIAVYLYTMALPAAGASAVWKYKGIYRLGDQLAGQWSDEVKISVMG